MTAIIWGENVIEVEIHMWVLTLREAILDYLTQMVGTYKNNPILSMDNQACLLKRSTLPDDRRLP